MRGVTWMCCGHVTLERLTRDSASFWRGDLTGVVGEVVT